MPTIFLIKGDISDLTTYRHHARHLCLVFHFESYITNNPMNNLLIVLRSTRNFYSAEIMAIAVFVLCVLCSFISKPQADLGLRLGLLHLENKQAARSFTSAYTASEQKLGIANPAALPTN
jgi:hypothetical protein